MPNDRMRPTQPNPTRGLNGDIRQPVCSVLWGLLALPIIHISAVPNNRLNLEKVLGDAQSLNTFLQACGTDAKGRQFVDIDGKFDIDETFDITYDTT